MKNRFTNCFSNLYKWTNGMLPCSLLIALLSFTSLAARSQNCPIGGVPLGNLTDYLFVFTDGNDDANWQGATKGFAGKVAVNGLIASERTSGTVPFKGVIYTNESSLNAWQDIVDDNLGQATVVANQTARLTNLDSTLQAAFTYINALPVTPGYNGIKPTDLDGLNTTDGVAQTIVINVTSGFSVSSKINITGDASDVFILRWDQDADYRNGYDGQVKFQSGGAIVPLGGLNPSNFIHVAGDLNSSGGGSTPNSPYPQGPRVDNGSGALISGGDDFSGGGFFTGYWLTTGSPSDGKNSSLSNGIFVGGWYTTATKFSMTSGTSGVYVSPNPCPVSVSGNVFNDPNAGNVNNSILPVGPNMITEGINAYLVKNGVILAKTTVGVDGIFKFTNVPSATGYTVMISSTPANIGEPTPATTLPYPWVITGEYIGTPNTGNSGNDGISETFNVANTDITHVNFGIERPSTPLDGLCPSVTNPGGTVQSADASEKFTGTDFDGGFVTHIIITGFPVRAKSLVVNGTFYLADDPIWATTGIKVPTTESGIPLQVITVDPAEEGGTTVIIPYINVDNAGVNSPTSATVTLPFEVPLPVKLISFEALKAEADILLNWSTAEESNSNFFVIERSTDGHQWADLGIIWSSKNSKAVQRYQFRDTNPAFGKNLYRLKMVDQDESFAYSRMVVVDSPLQVTSLKAYPSPASRYVQFEIDDWSSVNRIRVFNMLGQIVFTSKPSTTPQINIQTLPEGLYMIELTKQDFSISAVKILVRR